MLNGELSFTGVFLADDNIHPGPDRQIHSPVAPLVSLAGARLVRESYVIEVTCVADEFLPGDERAIQRARKRLVGRNLIVALTLLANLAPANRALELYCDRTYARSILTEGFLS